MPSTQEVDGTDVCSSQMGKNLRSTSRQKVLSKDSNSRGTSRHVLSKNHIPVCRRIKQVWDVVLRLCSLRLLVQEDQNAGGASTLQLYGRRLCRRRFFFLRHLKLPNAQRGETRFLKHSRRFHLPSSRCTSRSTKRAQWTVVPEASEPHWRYSARRRQNSTFWKRASLTIIGTLMAPTFSLKIWWATLDLKFWRNAHRKVTRG